MSILPAPDRGDLLFGIRPEDVMLGDTGLPVRVQNSEFLGADTVVTCGYGNQTLTARVPGKAMLAPGAAIHVGWRAEHVHVFDAASGRRRDDVRTLAVDKINFAQSFA
jgi:ABC-type sugar transport system ATPase subunit